MAYSFTDNQGNIILYSWWCPACVINHYDEYCPRDELVNPDFANVSNYEKKEQ